MLELNLYFLTSFRNDNDHLNVLLIVVCFQTDDMLSH